MLQANTFAGLTLEKAYSFAEYVNEKTRPELLALPQLSQLSAWYEVVESVAIAEPCDNDRFKGNAAIKDFIFDVLDIATIYFNRLIEAKPEMEQEFHFWEDQHIISE